MASSTISLPDNATFAFDALLANLIATFEQASAQQTNQIMLQLLLRYFRFDRGYCMALSAEGDPQMLCAIDPDGHELTKPAQLRTQLPWYRQHILAGQPVFLKRLPADFPDEAAVDCRPGASSGMRSLILIPLATGGRILGAISLIALRGAQARLLEPVGRLRLIGDLVASAMARRNAEHELRDVRQALHKLHGDRHLSGRAGSGDALAGSLTHELNQPLTAILSNAQAALRFLDRGEADRSEIREILEAIVQEDRRASAVIRGLHAMLRRDELARGDVDLSEIVDEVLLSMRGEFSREDVAVETHFDAGTAVSIDRAEVQQVVVNLIRNALESMQSQPRDARRLRLTIARDDGGRVAVSVRDSGGGITTEELPLLFLPFRTTKLHGMGLGLFIARAIIEAHGGEISVQRNADCGLEFTFRLPAAGRDTATDAPPAPDSEAASAAAALVWVVDDDVAVQESLRRLLMSAGFAVKTFSSPRELLGQAQGQQPACLLLDICLPEMTGPELCAVLLDQGMHIPVVFLTARGDIEAGVEAMKQGAVDYLLKPVDDGVLLRTVLQAVERHAAESEHERELATFEQRFQRLSLREREVMDCVVRGLLNKQIAAELGIAEATVKQHRGRVMLKMEVRSLAELVRLHDAAGHPPAA